MRRNRFHTVKVLVSLILLLGLISCGDNTNKPISIVDRVQQATSTKVKLSTALMVDVIKRNQSRKDSRESKVNKQVEESK